MFFCALIAVDHYHFGSGCSADQIQVQKPILVVAADQMPDHTYSRDNLLHLMCAIARAHAVTHVTSLMCVKNCMHHFCL